MAKKELDTELNLTSMIDLMSTLVAFLLVTAVWLHLAAIPASVESKGKAPVASDKPPEDKTLKVRVTKSGYRLSWPRVKGQRPPKTLRKSKKDGYPMEALTLAVKQVLDSGKQLDAFVEGENRVKYGVVAETIDAVKAAGVGSVAMLTN